MTVSEQTGTRGPGGGRKGGSTVTTTVVRTEALSPGMIRVVLGGDGLAAFAANDYTDAYVKLLFPIPGVEYDHPLDAQAIRAARPSTEWPRQRTYTVRAWDPAARELTIDFVVHGDEGLAGPWARGAKPGDEIALLGPGGGYAPDPAADWHLYVGDESAIPAIAAALENLAAKATGYAFIEVHDPAEEQALIAPAGVTITWVHRHDRPLGQAAVEAVTGLEFPAGTVQAFVHGEAAMVRDLRRLLKVERGVPVAQLSISGYWRQGADDEGWRTVKRDWNRAIEASEAG